MNRTIVLTTMALGLGIVLPGPAVAQTAKDLVGTWSEVSNVNIRQDGSRADMFVPGSKGLVVFDGNGPYASVTINAILPKFASGNRNTGTPEENKAIVQGSLAHYGTYTVADKVITLKVEGSTWPAWTGTDQKRTIISYTGDDIKWSLAATIGGTSEIGWKRLK